MRETTWISILGAVLFSFRRCSQEELAKRLHVPADWYAKVERGRVCIGIQRLCDICDKINAPLIDVFSACDSMRRILVERGVFVHRYAPRGRLDNPVDRDELRELADFVRQERDK